MKYKQLNDIQAETILTHRPSTNDFGIYLKHFGYGMADLNTLIRFAVDSKLSCWIDWLINHGFIEEVKKEKVYQVGNKFHAQGQTYELRCHTWGQHDSEDYIAGMFSVTYGNDWTGIMVRVKNRCSITEADIKEMLGDIPFEPVKK